MGHSRALHMSTGTLSSGGQMARSHHSPAPAGRPHRHTRCAPAVSAAEPGEDGVPPNERRVSGGSKHPRANLSPVSQASASYAVAANSPSSAARRAQRPSSAIISATRLTLRSGSAASSRRPRRREQRSTVDFIMKSRREPVLPRCHPYLVSGRTCCNTIQYNTIQYIHIATCIAKLCSRP